MRARASWRGLRAHPRPWMIALLLLAMPSLARAECKINLVAELPVTMEGLRPTVPVKIDDKPVRMMVDSGAFWSTMSAPSAAQLGVHLSMAPPGFYVGGIGGMASVQVTSVTLTLADQPIPKVDFLVGGTDLEGGTAGLIGQNILRLADIEYDLAAGALRFWRPKDCAKANLAYWAKDAPISMVPIEPTTPLNPHITTTVVLNGVKLRAVLDTGAPTSFLSRSAAHRAGVNPDDATVSYSGLSGGIGKHLVKTWVGKFDSFEIGGVRVNHPKLRFAEGEIGLPNVDMLLGDDFFLSTRILAATSQKTLFFTYNGGRMFDLSQPSGPSKSFAVTPDGKPVALPAATEPTDAAGYARRGASLLARGDVDGALADLDKANVLAPNNAEYLFLRARARLSTKREKDGGADLDAAIAIDPRNVEMRLFRAALRLQAKDRAGALADADAARDAVPAQSNTRIALASLYDRLDQFPAAVAQYDGWIASHREDAGMVVALNGRCWARALGNIELNKALDDCNRADQRLHNAAILDSRALVHLRRGEYALAITDYNAALSLNNKLPWSLYGRGIAKIRLGKPDEGKADMAAAEALDGELPARASSLGVVP